VRHSGRPRLHVPHQGADISTASVRREILARCTCTTVERCRGSRGSLDGPTPMWYARGMILRLVRVVALLVVACLAPSLAYAHAGHTHHADHASAPADIAAPV